MRLVIQRAGGASVVSDGVPTGQIGRGLAVFVGVSQGDTEAQADFLVSKLLNLRIFEDDAGKMNLSVTDIGGEHDPDHLHGAHPDTCWQSAIKHGVRIGLGSDWYELVTVR